MKTSILFRYAQLDKQPIKLAMRCFARFLKWLDFLQRRKVASTSGIREYNFFWHRNFFFLIQPANRATSVKPIPNWGGHSWPLTKETTPTCLFVPLTTSGPPTKIQQPFCTTLDLDRVFSPESPKQAPLIKSPAHNIVNGFQVPTKLAMHTDSGYATIFAVCKMSGNVWMIGFIDERPQPWILN